MTRASLTEPAIICALFLVIALPALALLEGGRWLASKFR